MAVSLLNAQTRRVRTSALRRAARRLLLAEGLGRAEVNVLLTDDAAIHEFNLRYRGIDEPTDVLSFAQRESQDGAPSPPTIPGHAPILGDLIISVETAARQAEAHDDELENELALLAVHGILHLIGHEDESDEGAEIMRARQFEILGTGARKY